nr:hypothetical protein [Desulfobulbaceae bacterium]
MTNKRQIFSGLALIIFSLIIFCGLAQAKNGKVHLTDKIKSVPPQSGLYAQNIQPLQLQQCAQCHIGVFNLLKTQGQRHQKDCTFCHEVYHTYAPGKVEYQDAIPKCKDCHGTPHGDLEFVQDCSKCHSNAHSPINLPDITGDICFNCHANPPKELEDFPSKHTSLACTECHTTHGFIPNCTDCHSEKGGEVFHVDGAVQNPLCMTCHAGPHKPMIISYSDSTPQEQCGTCHKNPSHAEVFKVIRAANSKHNTEVTCAGCHDQHGKIPDCSACHDQEGHRAGLATADCLRCHSNPHAPMNISFAITEPQKVCGGCHTDVYNELVNNKTRHTNQTCAFCHPVHGQIPTCQKCHGVPHGEAMLQQFGGNCGGCHGIAHNVQGRMKEDKEGSLTEEGRKGVLTTVK